MSRKTLYVSYGVAFDAVAGRPASCAGEDSPLDISRGMFAGEVGVPRLLTLFERFGIKSTWFVPGHSIETFPDEARMVVDAGHEVGLRGYAHENPAAMSPAQEARVLDRSIELVTELCGVRPRGHVAPGRAFSAVTAQLLLSRGIVYDHSLMHDDFHPYYVRSGDRRTEIDYSRPADEWMKPLLRGTRTPLIEIPAGGHLDDRAPLAFVERVARSAGLHSPRVMEETWRDTFDWVYRECDYAVFPMTLHPDVSGRPQALLMHERLFEHMSAHAGVQFVTLDRIASDFARRQPLED